MRIYILQTIFRREPHDPKNFGTFNWPLLVHDDSTAKAKADQLLSNWPISKEVPWSQIGDAVCMLVGDREIAWKSFIDGSPYADWTAR